MAPNTQKTVSAEIDVHSLYFLYHMHTVIMTPNTHKTVNVRTDEHIVWLNYHTHTANVTLASNIQTGGCAYHMAFQLPSGGK